MFLATLKYCFKSAPTPAPRHTADLLEPLRHHNHAITTVTKRGLPIHMAAKTPSWLTSGRQRHISFFHDFFYGEKGATPVGCTACPLCHAHLREQTLWQHLLYPCPDLLTAVPSSPKWTAFVELLRRGHQGLAIYTSLPLFHSHYDGIMACLAPPHPSPSSASIPP